MHKLSPKQQQQQRADRLARIGKQQRTHQINDREYRATVREADTLLAQYRADALRAFLKGEDTK